MKKKFEDILNTAGNHIALSSAEKARMDRVLKTYMQHKPLPKTDTYSVSVSHRWFSFTHLPVPALLALALVFMGGISYAAEGSLPGDTLYAVKTNVNEPARLALATNVEAKAEVQIELAERRIEEATVLAAEGRLDAGAQEQLAVAFEEHSNAVKSSIAEVEATDSAASIELASRFENRLVAHESVLAEVEYETETEIEFETGRSHPLVDVIRTTNMALAEARFNRSNVALNVASAPVDAALMAATAPSEGAAEPAVMTMSLAADAPAEMTTRSAHMDMGATISAKQAPAPTPAPAPDAKTISRMKSAAEKSLKTAEKTLGSRKNLSAEARTRAEGDISLAKNLIVTGDEHLTNDFDADAYYAFEESLRVSEQAVVYMKASPVLEKLREKNRSNRGKNSSNSNTEVRSETQVQVAAPGVETNISVPVSISPMPARVDDNPSSDDANDDHGSDDSEQERNDDSKSSKSGSWFKLDLSL